MGFTLRHRDGSEEDGDVSMIPAFLAELDEPRDDEHPDIAIGDESSWTLSAFQTGGVVWENVEERDSTPRHMKDLPRAEVRRLMTLVADGNLDEVERQPWKAGYGSS